jgi:dTDP-4-amino-4,6-dideoxygalactose transaminase
MPPCPATIGLSVTTSPTKSESSKLSLAKPNPSAVPLPDSVPMLDLQRQYEQVRAEVLAAVGRVCASQHYILGPEVEAFEREVADFCGAHDAVGCSSGTDALWLALAAAGVQPGDQVLTTPFSFFASASAIARAGARPVFADIEASTLNLDPTQVESFLRNRQRDKLRALLPVHLYGQCADMDRFQMIADEFHLSLIEDAAQAIGASWRGRRAGTMGVSAAFSFYPTKNLSAYGDAGLVTTSNPEMAAHMRRLRNHGSPRRYVHDEVGWNSRLDAIQAAILRVKLKYVEGWNEARRQCAARYDQLFAATGLLRLSNFRRPRRMLTTFSTSTSSAPTVATNCASSSLRGRSVRKSTIPSRCTCSPVSFILGTAKATCPEPNAPRKRCSPCPCSPNSPKWSSVGWLKASRTSIASSGLIGVTFLPGRASVRFRVRG